MMLMSEPIGPQAGLAGRFPIDQQQYKAIDDDGANLNGGQTVPLCVAGLKAAFQEFIYVMEAVLATEEKRLALERGYLNEQRCEAETWAKHGADQFRLWKAATERTENLCASLSSHHEGLAEERAGLTQERGCLEEAATSARTALAEATMVAVSCSEPYSTPRAAGAAQESSSFMGRGGTPSEEHPLDEVYRFQNHLSTSSFDLPPSAFDSVLLPTTRSFLSSFAAIRPRDKASPTVTTTSPVTSEDLAPRVPHIEEKLISTLSPSQLVTPVKQSDESKSLSSPVVTRVASDRPQGTAASERPPMPDEPDAELLPTDCTGDLSREGTRCRHGLPVQEQALVRMPGELWVLHEELDI